MTGFDGKPFLFKGYPDAHFAMLSHPEHQVNALLTEGVEHNPGARGRLADGQQTFFFIVA